MAGVMHQAAFQKKHASPPVAALQTWALDQFIQESLCHTRCKEQYELQRPPCLV